MRCPAGKIAWRVGGSRLTAEVIGTRESRAERRGDTVAIDGAYQHRARTSGFVVQRFWHFQKERVIRKFAPARAGERVIDIGCGSGVVSDLLASLGARTTGVDGNPEAIDYARRTFHRPGLDFRLGLVGQLEFEPESANKIYWLELLEHIHADQGRELLKTSFRLCRPGGRLIVTMPNYRGLWPLVEWTLDFLRVAAPLAVHQHVTRLSRESLRSLLVTTGWRLETLTTFSTFAPFLSVIRWSLAERFAELEDRLSFPFENILLAVARKPLEASLLQCADGPPQM
jgi:2-polyprenyl-3-methyl-5-hydroxy-6-metoxy-1,4-benzoquinol methylase